MRYLYLLKSFFLVLTISLVSLSAMSQGSTTSWITGKIIDNNGGDLPGATIVAVHEPTGTKYGVSSRADGRYDIPNMKIGGPYTVDVTFVGYQGQKVTDIFLTLGQKFNLNFVLIEEATTMEEIVVTAEENSVINKGRTGSETNIDNAQLKILPTISRSASDIYRLTPQSSGNSFGGRNDQYNNFSLDGSIFNNPFGLDAATPGGQTDAQPISLDAIDQIQVSIAPYDVTQAGFTGAGINAVTKSGTNKIAGTVFGFYRNQDLTGSKVSGTDIIVPELSQFQGGFSIGGPIIKNKLFFFANAETERRQDAGTNVLAAATGRSGENVSRVSAADLNAVRTALAGRGYQTGAYEGFTHDTENIKGIVKLDWNINEKHSLTATYNFLDASKDKPAHPSALGRRGPDLTTIQFQNSGYTINNKIQSGIIELKSVISNTVSNKFQAGFTAFRDTRDPFSAPAPVININQDGVRAIVAGHEPFSINNRLDQDVIQISNNVNFFQGNHTFTVGGSFEKFTFNNSFNLGVYEPFGYPYDGGTFGGGFASVADFLQYVADDSLDAVLQHAQNTFDSNNANDSWALAETNVGQLAFYVQDEWAVSDDFNLTIGLRVDKPLYFNTPDKIQENIDRKGGLVSDGGNYDPTTEYFDENGNSVTFDHTVLPEELPLFSPRIGFNWDVNGDGSLQLRGGSGLFTGRLPFVWIGNHVANPDWFFYNITRDDFQFPQVWRTNIGYDQKINGGWTLSGDIIYTKDFNAMIVRNYGLNLPTGTLNGVDNRPIYQGSDRATFDGFGFPIVTNAYVFTNTDEGRSINATIQLQRNWSNGLYTSLAYNYLDSKDASSIEAEISSDAYDRNPAFGHVNQVQLSPSLYGNQHRVVGSLNKKFEYGGGKRSTTVSMFFEYAKGGRFSYTYSGDINNDGSGNNDLIYIPTDGEIDNMAFDASAASPTDQRTALKNFIAQDDYLSGRRGQYAEKYSALSPWFSQWDLRVLQDFKVGDSENTIQLSLDILNVGNFISSSWGVRQLPINTQALGVSVDGAGNPTYSFDPSVSSTFVDDFSLRSRWQMQFGLRYIF